MVLKFCCKVGEGRIFLQFPVEGQREKYFLNRDFLDSGAIKEKSRLGVRKTVMT